MKKLSFVLFAVIFCVPVLAISTVEIESVRMRTEAGSSELSASDKAAIAKFWDTASNTMPLAETANEVVQIRRQLEDQKGTEPLSFYATAYIAVAQEKLQTAFGRLETLSDPVRKELIKRNLMILTAQLKSAKLVPLALQKIDDADDVVRYWAVKTVTQPAVISQLVSDLTRDEETVAEIMKALKTRTDVETNGGILEMIIDFTMAIDTDASRQLIMSVADQRTKSYMDWSVTNEHVDVKLLTAMSFLIANQQNATVQSQLAQKFAILYSMSFQRYMLGKETLTDEQLAGVLTVMAEVAQTALDKNMEIKTRIVDVLRRGTGLEREYEALFGDRMRAGQLGTTYKFNYGKDASGKAMTAPPKLGPPPAAPQEIN
jgi:hypothetical protein